MSNETKLITIKQWAKMKGITPDDAQDVLEELGVEPEVPAKYSLDKINDAIHEAEEFEKEEARFDSLSPEEQRQEYLKIFEAWIDKSPEFAASIQELRTKFI